VPQTSADSSPQVRFAPALILRRHSPRSLIDFYAKAIGQLRDEAIPVPATIRDMVEILDDLDQPEAATGPEPPEARALAPPPGDAEPEAAAPAAPPGGAEVYFPLPSNDEQLRIVERLARHRGVIVQGPPGTGKSHRIANLISHLAALGKRVLVTSHTGRALEVLKGKLPPDIAQLCVSMVGDGRRGTGDLDRSVQALVARATDPYWDEPAIDERVGWLWQRLGAVAEERRELLAVQREIREREIEDNTPPFDGYHGKLAEIARRLRDEEVRHGWLTERPAAAQPAPLDDAEASELLGLLRHVRGEVAARAQHLRAYQSAMRRYGKGTGKHAASHLASAQRHMESCQDAVPAWIMPTYRVAEVIPPHPHTFDVVIVDEASQSGVDALFLLWLAPKVVVVGDDRQISPDNIGVDRHLVERLQRQHLPDVELRDLLGLDNSLHDQTASRYRGRIWLQEHFRCMPEIIEFSNRLSYGDHLLVPLRQFGTDRLEPPRTVHVEHAETFGNDQGRINDDEAIAIVERIGRCLADPRYDGRSMGVVSLLGGAQAKRIHDLLVERIGPEEIVARRLKCGTAYDFQGDERSVMFLSTVVTPPANGRRLLALGGRGNEQRFNVAASRAQDQLWLFHSLRLADLNPECVRWKLLSHCLNPPPALDSGDLPRLAEIDGELLQEPFTSLFEQQVYLRLRRRGHRVVAKHQVHGFRVDLVVLGERSRLAIACEATPGTAPTSTSATWLVSGTSNAAAGASGACAPASSTATPTPLWSPCGGSSTTAASPRRQPPRTLFTHRRWRSARRGGCGPRPCRSPWPWRSAPRGQARGARRAGRTARPCRG
jgi:hypothetical protein